MNPINRNACVRAIADIMRASSDGFCAIDGHDRVIAINPVLCQGLSLASDEDACDHSLFDMAGRRLDVRELRDFLGGEMTRPLDLRLSGEPPFAARVSGRTVAEAGEVRFLVFKFESDYAQHLINKRNEVRELAYEIRTPLASVYGFSELLLTREFQADKQREFIEIIYQEAGRLARHVEQLLHLELDIVEENREGESG